MEKDPLSSQQCEQTLVITKMASFSHQGGREEQKKWINSPNCQHFLSFCLPKRPIQWGMDGEGRADVHSDGSPPVNSHSSQVTNTAENTHKQPHCLLGTLSVVVKLLFGFRFNLWVFTNDWLFSNYKSQLNRMIINISDEKTQSGRICWLVLI